jgi:HSP20 family protein
MAVSRWDPFKALATFDREFDDIVRRGWGGTASRAGFVPPVEMLTRDRDVVIRLELPGIDVARDVDITVHNGTLIVRGERRDDRAEQMQGAKAGVLVRELRYGSFVREFALPEGVDGESIEASYDLGMLEILVRNAVPERPQPRSVPIRNAGHATEISATNESSD